MKPPYPPREGPRERPCSCSLCACTHTVRGTDRVCFGCVETHDWYSVPDQPREADSN